MLVRLSTLEIGDYFNFPMFDKEYEICFFFTPHNKEICVYYDKETDKYYCCSSMATVEQF